MKKLFLLLVTVNVTFFAQAQAWRSFNILSGNPNATGNEIRFLNGTTGCLGSTIATTNGVPAGNNNLPYGAAFDPTESKLYYSKAGTTAGTTVFNVYNNTGAVATNTNLATITGGEYFRMGVGQDGNVYGTVTALVIQLSASAPRIDIHTVKLTRYNPTTNTFTILGNIQCPSAYASTMPAPYNDGNYWSSSDATTTPFYAAQLGSAIYGDLVVSPGDTMYMTIGKKLIRIPNYQSITGTGLISSAEVGNVLPTGVGFNFTTQGPGTYGLSWDYNSGNMMAVSSRTSDGSDGSYNINPATGALVGSFRVNCLSTPTSANFADLTEVLSSIGMANQLTTVQWLGYNNKYRLTYRVRIENIGTSIIKSAQSTLNLTSAFPTLTISNVSASFVSNPAGLVLNTSYNGIGTNTLLNGAKTLYSALYNGADLNGGVGNVTAGSHIAVIDVTFDVAGVATNGTTTYNCTAVGSGTGFDATTLSDNSDNGTSVETGAANYKADGAGEGDPTPIKFGSSVSGTVWNDMNNSAAGTFTNIFTTGETGTNAGGLFAILIDPVTNLVLQSVAVGANGVYTFSDVPSFANLQVRLSATAGTAGSAPPAASLPSGWNFTSPGSTNTTGNINTGTYDHTNTTRFGAIDDINNDFGIMQLPPTIIATGSLSSFTACAGTASAAQSFSVSGSGLSANIIVTAPAGFEVSATLGSGYGSSVTLTQSGGTVSVTTVYARLASTASGTPGGNITCASTGATTQNVLAGGTVNTAITANTATASQTICTGSTPAGLTGSTPAGGNGSSYTYSWLSSTTSAVSGFSAASGTNNNQNYTPGSLTVTTWYRRMVVSGVCASDTSVAVAITVNAAGTWTGATSNAWNNTANWSCPLVPVSTTNITINSGAPNMPVITDAQQCNNLTIGTGATLTLNNAASALSLFGTITNSGTFTNSNGVISFNGSAVQTVPAGTYAKLRINNASGLNLGGNITLNDSLILSNGVLALGNNNLVLGNNAFASAGSTASYVRTNGTGNMVLNNVGSSGKTGTLQIPVGNSSFNPATLINTGTSDNFTIWVIDSVTNTFSGNTPAGAKLASNAINRTWIVTEGVAGGSNATITLQWNTADELAGFNRAASYVARHTGTTWLPVTANTASGSNPYSQSRSNINAFGPLGVGSSGTLPVDLISFKAVKVNKAVNLDWVTAGEVNSHYFEVERSADGIVFEAIATVKGKGNTTSASVYGTSDEQAQGFAQAHGIKNIFYRLKQVDVDEAYTYSKTITVNMSGIIQELSLQPNPFIQEVQVLLNSNQAGEVQLEITDVQGRLILSQVARAVEGDNRISLDRMASLKEGVYFVRIHHSHEVSIIRLVKLQ